MKNLPSLRTVILVSATGLILSATSARAILVGAVDLGTAGPDNYTILALGGTAPDFNETKVTLNNETLVTGNVGVAGSGSISMSGNGFVSDTLFLGSGVNLNNSGSSGATTIVQNADAKLNQAVTDALSAAAQASTLNSTISLSSITGTQTVTGIGGNNVLNLTNLTLGNNEVLTLSAPAGGSFVINVSNSFGMTGGRIVLAGDLTPFEVLYNVEGTGSAIHFSGGGNASQISGILLAPSRNIALAPGLVIGEIIGGGKELTLTSGADATVIPEVPACLPLLGVLGTVLLTHRVRRQSPAQLPEAS